MIVPRPRVAKIVGGANRHRSFLYKVVLLQQRCVEGNRRAPQNNKIQMENVVETKHPGPFYSESLKIWVEGRHNSVQPGG